MLNYDRLYALLDDLTPLPADCGTVCAAACCLGGENDGMLLFPGVAARLGGDGCIREENGRTLFVCNGRCDRRRRPLSCRLFPLFPLLQEDGHLRVVYDPRAFRVCPLLPLQHRVRLQPAFVRAVQQVGFQLRKDPDTRAFLQEQSRELIELGRFFKTDTQRAPICRRK